MAAAVFAVAAVKTLNVIGFEFFGYFDKTPYICILKDSFHSNDNALQIMVTIQFPSPSDVSIDRLLRFLRKENMAFTYVPNSDNEPSEVDAAMAEKFKAPFFVELKEAIDEIKAIQRGEKPHGQSLSDFLDELDAELETEKNVLENAH